MLALRPLVALALLMLAMLAGCTNGGEAPGNGNEEPPRDGGEPHAGDGATRDAAVTADGANGSTLVDGGLADGGTSLSTRMSAIEQTIENDALCSALPEFYWEIGGSSGALVSGSVGTTFKVSTEMNIASASKLVFGAYVVERFNSDLSKMNASAMRMLSGYTSLDYDTCVGASTVSSCFMAGMNSTYTASDLNLFFYNGGHFQKYAVDLGLGGDDNAALTADIKAQVGTEFSFTYSSPQLAGGIRTSAGDYAAFLRKILQGKLAIRDHLGENAVCTEPASCPTAVSSPAPAAWHYSYAHWVEDDPMTGDGAFSSPGAFGFYPWIDATKTYYGIVARYSLAAKAYVESAECGISIRKAFVTGLPQ